MISKSGVLCFPIHYSCHLYLDNLAFPEGLLVDIELSQLGPEKLQHSVWGEGRQCRALLFEGWYLPQHLHPRGHLAVQG